MTETPEQAYRRGQEEMRRRCEKLVHGWYWNSLAVHMRPLHYRKRGRVDVALRMLKLEPYRP